MYKKKSISICLNHCSTVFLLFTIRYKPDWYIMFYAKLKIWLRRVGLGSFGVRILPAAVQCRELDSNIAKLWYVKHSFLLQLVEIWVPWAYLDKVGSAIVPDVLQGAKGVIWYECKNIRTGHPQSTTSVRKMVQLGEEKKTNGFNWIELNILAYSCELSCTYVILFTCLKRV